MVVFWINKDNAFRSHKGGLSSNEIKFLHSLQEGDRLVLFPADPDSHKLAPDLTLKKAEFKS